MNNIIKDKIEKIKTKIRNSEFIIIFSGELWNY